MTTPKATTCVTTPNDREVCITRVFEAPRSLVYACHMEPVHLPRWLAGEPEWTMPVCEVDVRVGGRYHYVWRRTEAGTEPGVTGGQFGFIGEYREIVAPERVVHTEWDDASPGGPDAEALCTLQLAETENATRTTLSLSMVFPSPEARDKALGYGMTDGMSKAYERLDKLLSELKETSTA